jgi:carboxypeptidase Q
VRHSGKAGAGEAVLGASVRPQAGAGVAVALAVAVAGVVGVAGALGVPGVARAQDAARASQDAGGTVNRIVDQAYNHGQVVQTVAHLTDRIGGRLTNSPGMRDAERWTQQQFKAYGLSNVHTEGFEFGRGWWIEESSLRMTAPRPITLRAIPVAWTPATQGEISAPIVIAPMSDPKHFDAWKGKLAGKIVLVSHPAPPKDATEAAFQRVTDAQIKELDSFEPPSHDHETIRSSLKRRAFALKLDAFLKGEGALAWARMSRRPNGLVHGDGYTYQVGKTPALPAVEIAQEDYRRLARLAKGGPVTLELRNTVHFTDDDTQARNVLAEIPGSDPGAGYVMAGAHLDSWVAADGAADNAAGSAVVMEAARILSRLGVQPKRTIRFVLWSGEEQGTLGSYAYVAKHLATRPALEDPEEVAGGPGYASRVAYPVTPLPGFRDMKLYLNMDNGGGKLRGIHAEGNFAAVPVLKSWIAPLGALGASAVVAKPTGATDHVGMARLGLPAFQFIQDPLDYGSTVHHSSADSFDHLRPDDLRQAAAVMATLLLTAANSEQTVPANVLPTRPSDSDPFKYKDPAVD